MIVTSYDDQVTGAQVVEKIKKVVNAREEGVRIDKIRQARGRTVIIGCKNAEEIRRVKEKIQETSGMVNVEDIRNKDLLVTFYGVLRTNTDEDLIKALKNQIGHLTGKNNGDTERIEIKYSRKPRNPHTEML